MKRRFFLFAAPAIVAAPSLMRVSTMPSDLEAERMLVEQFLNAVMRQESGGYHYEQVIIQGGRGSFEPGQRVGITSAHINGEYEVAGSVPDGWELKRAVLE